MTDIIEKFRAEFRERVKREKVRTLDDLRKLHPKDPCFNRRISDYEREFIEALEARKALEAEFEEGGW